MGINPKTADYLPKLINKYVPACTYVAADAGANRISLGSPAVASATGLKNSAAITNAASTVTIDGTADSPFGRAVQIKGDTAGDNAVCTVNGRDYLGQPMKENLTLSGTSAVTGTKAFYWVDTVSVASGNANASSSIDLGWRDVLGLPFKTVKILSEEDDGALVGTLGTLVGPVMTDPQTATTGDPRGTYDPNTTLDGASEVIVTCVFDAYVNSSNNGGYYGIKHYNG
jgi:hypothetical protein